MKPVRLRSIAEGEVAEAISWCTAQSPDVAGRFVEVIDEATVPIQQARGLSDGHRSWQRTYPIITGNENRIRPS